MMGCFMLSVDPSVPSGIGASDTNGSIFGGNFDFKLGEMQR
jgi:hypothetical protein